MNKLPVILSREEIWRMLQCAELLKHKLLIGLIYGCGLRCMESETSNLSIWTFTAGCCILYMVKVRKSGMCLLEQLIWGLKTFINIENPNQYLFNGNQNRNIEEIDTLTTKSTNFASRYSQRGVQWVIKTISRQPTTFVCELNFVGKGICVLQRRKPAEKHS